MLHGVVSGGMKPVKTSNTYNDKSAGDFDALFFELFHRLVNSENKDI